MSSRDSWPEDNKYCDTSLPDPFLGMKDELFHLGADLYYLSPVVSLYSNLQFKHVFLVAASKH